VHTQWRAASREELIAELERQQREIGRQRREIERLRREHERADQDRNRYQQERDKLRKKIERLEDELETARRSLHRQAAPFSRGVPRRSPRRPGRKPGGAYGRPAHRAVPDHVDETYIVPLPPVCPTCGGGVTLTRHATQYQEDLPVVRPIVRVFAVAIGACTECGRRVQGRHALQASDALGAAAAQLGPEAVTLTLVLNKQLGLPLGKIVTLLRERFGLAVSAGGLVHAMRRAARRAESTYTALGETIRGSPVVTPDETGWKVAARLQWLWAFATPDTTLYAIRRGRGFEEAAAVLGADFAGVLVRDGWAPYRRFTSAIHQTCLAHLLRRCRTLIREHEERQFAPRVQRVLQHALGVRNRYQHRRISAHGVAVARGHLVNQLNALIDRPGPARVARQFAPHLAIEFPPSSRSCSSPTSSMRPTGEPNMPSAPPWSPAKSAVGIAARKARIPTPSSRGCFGRSSNAASMQAHSSRSCCAHLTPLLCSRRLQPRSKITR
jgi:transposase